MATTQRTAEISFECPADELSVLDGYCSATGRKRTSVMRQLLREWSASKHREAVSIVRVAGDQPDAADSTRGDLT